MVVTMACETLHPPAPLMLSSWLPERLAIYDRTASVSAAHATHCATYCIRVGRSYAHFSGGFEIHLLHVAAMG